MWGTQRSRQSRLPEVGMNYIQLNRVIIFLTVLEDCISIKLAEFLWRFQFLWNFVGEKRSIVINVVIYEVNLKPSSFLLVNLVNLCDQPDPNVKCAWGNLLPLSEILNYGDSCRKDSISTTKFSKCDNTLRNLCPFFGRLSRAKSRNFTWNQCNWEFSEVERFPKAGF